MWFVPRDISAMDFRWNNVACGVPPHSLFSGYGIMEEHVVAEKELEETGKEFDSDLRKSLCEKRKPMTFKRKIDRPRTRMTLITHSIHNTSLYVSLVRMFVRALMCTETMNL